MSTDELGSPLATLASGKLGPRARRALNAYALATMGVTLGRKGWQALHTARTFTVAVSADDRLYGPLHEWVLERLPATRRRAVIARTARLTAGPESPSDGRQAGASLHLHYDGNRPQWVTIGGHRVRVEVERSDVSPTSDQQWMRPDRIVFHARTFAARQAVLDVLADLTAREFPEPKPRLFMPSRWGGWNERSDLPGRSLSTVVLRAGQAEALEADLRAFLDAEPVYARMGVPWHRGYLLAGPPGTGKTSVARALASELGLDVYYLPLADVKLDGDLLAMFGEIQPRTMLLLEDIDVMHATRERDDDKAGITMSGLLNAVDGVATPHGLVTVMTTNEPDVVDPALLRPGRVDRRDEVGYLDDEQLNRLVRVMAGVQTDLRARERLTAAEVVEVCKVHVGDELGLRRALHELTEGEEVA